MFKSINYIKIQNSYLTADGGGLNFEVLFELIDDDFQENCLGFEPDDIALSESGITAESVSGCNAVIRLYENKNLNVSANIIYFFNFIINKYKCSIKEQIEWNIKYNTLFPKYKEEIEKYLLLL
jgi:hypothetical protein